MSSPGYHPQIDFPRIVTLPPNDGTLGPAPGKVINLTSGGNAATHYQLEGDERWPLVVLIHGIADFSYRFDSLSAALRQSNLRVLRFDAYGRGWSDTPAKCKFDLETHVTQLEELLSALDLTKGGKCILMAHSMGGLTATNFSVRHPGLIAGLVLFAPAGIMASPVFGFSWAQSILRRFPSVVQRVPAGDPPPGDWVSVKDDPQAKQYADWDLAWLHAGAKKNGGKAFGGSVAEMPLVSNKACIEQLAQVQPGIQVLLFHADQDPMVVIKPKHIDVYRKLLGENLESALISGGGHCFFIQEQDEVMPKIHSFLARVGFAANAVA
eukprot:CAMPEP_0206444578 /NCGR_PEP_ID=MMETSP0324_2-20121206/14993_1 /ASSEMBLY_ACC=CAM_ASM_000836 /TAXON_ID=2866 /ORGANISM="Crypthecodinium cohnii, Strain Seligo" /LENGTH=323 /DNA_ID=CAMNT_0053912623 /DNA_START=101 /DNA_END=1072 /DNA_ORIENTATION=+